MRKQKQTNNKVEYKKVIAGKYGWYVINANIQALPVYGLSINFI